MEFIANWDHKTSSYSIGYRRQSPNKNITIYATIPFGRPSTINIELDDMSVNIDIANMHCAFDELMNKETTFYCDEIKEVCRFRKSIKHIKNYDITRICRKDYPYRKNRHKIVIVLGASKIIKPETKFMFYYVNNKYGRKFYLYPLGADELARENAGKGAIYNKLGYITKELCDEYTNVFPLTMCKYVSDINDNYMDRDSHIKYLSRNEHTLPSFIDAEFVELPDIFVCGGIECPMFYIRPRGSNKWVECRVDDRSQNPYESIFEVIDLAKQNQITEEKR